MFFFFFFLNKSAISTSHSLRYLFSSEHLSEVAQTADFPDFTSLHWAACTLGKFFFHKYMGVISMHCLISKAERK